MLKTKQKEGHESSRCKDLPICYMKLVINGFLHTSLMSWPNLPAPPSPPLPFWLYPTPILCSSPEFTACCCSLYAALSSRDNQGVNHGSCLRGGGRSGYSPCKTDFNFIGTVESQTDNFLKKSVLAHVNEIFSKTNRFTSLFAKLLRKTSW